MGASALNIESILTTLNRVNVRKGVYKQFDEGTILLDAIEKGDFNSPAIMAMMGEKDGEKLRIQAHTGGNPNVGVGVKEGHEYPKAGSQDYGALYYRSVRLLAGMAQTTEAISRARTSEQAVFSAAAREMMGMIGNIRKRANFYMFGDGSGLMATGHASTGFNISTDLVTVLDASQLENGMELMPRGTDDGSTIGGGVAPTGHDSTSDDEGNTVYEPVKVTSLDKTAKTFTAKYYNGDAYDATTAAEFNDIGWYLWDQQGKVPFGLGNICSTTNPTASGFPPGSTLPTDDVGMSAGFGGIDRNTSGNEWWQALTKNNLGGTQLDIKNHLQPTAINLITRDSALRNSGDVLCIMDGTRWDTLINELEAGKRTKREVWIVDGKHKGVQYDIFTFAWDPDCPAGTVTANSGQMFFFVPKHLFRLIVTSWQMENRGGGNYTQLLGPLGRPTGKWRANLEFEGQTVCASVLGCTRYDNVG